jgi:FkbM family methyltransferase
MKNFLKKLYTRFITFKNHDRFSWLFRERRRHLSFVDDLCKIFPKVNSMTSMGNYEIPTTLLQNLNNSSTIITGGVEFHIEFEELLDQHTSASFHFFEVDHRSIEWFKENKARSNFKMVEMGLGSQKGTLPVYGNQFLGFSSSVDPKIYQDSELDFTVIGQSEITTLYDYCNENNISQIDLLKLDIEGMALEVLYSAWDNQLIPISVLLEVERGEHVTLESFKEEINFFTSRAELLNYKVIFLKRNDPYNSFTVEFFLIQE